MITYATRRPSGLNGKVTTRTLTWLITLIAICGMVLASCSSPMGQSHPSTPEPVWDRLLNSIGPDGHWNLTTSLQAFALAIGPLPGVTVPRGPVGLIVSGDIAVDEIFYHWSQLSSSQQKAVLALLGQPPTTSGSTGSIQQTTALARASQPVRSAPGKTGGEASHRTSDGICTQPLVTTGNGAPTNYATMVSQLVPQICAQLGRALTLELNVSYSTKLEASYEPPGTPAWADCYNSTGSKSEPATACIIDLAQKNFDSLSPEDKLFIFAHEVFHCFEADAFATLGEFRSRAKWLVEGEATWVGEILAPGMTYAQQAIWASYFDVPNTPVTQRAYSAVGFYQLLAQVTDEQKVWKVLDPMLRASSNAGAYQVATQLGGAPFLYSLGSTNQRNASLGSDWDMTAPFIPTFDPHAAMPESLGASGKIPVSAQTYASNLYAITSHADVVEVGINGYARLHDSASYDTGMSGLADNYFCTKSGGCSCPSGSTSGGLVPQPVNGVLHLALTGGLSGASGTVVGMSLSTYCTMVRQAQNILQKFASAPLHDMTGPFTNTNGGALVFSGTMQYIGGANPSLLLANVQFPQSGQQVSMVYIQGNTACVYYDFIGHWILAGSGSSGFSSLDIQAGFAKLQSVTFANPKNQVINGHGTDHLRGAGALGTVYELWVRTDNYLPAKEVVDLQGGVVLTYVPTAWNTGAPIFAPPASCS